MELDPEEDLELNKIYQVRVRVMASDDWAKSTWSDWSPTASWRSLIGRTKITGKKHNKQHHVRVLYLYCTVPIPITYQCQDGFENVLSLYSCAEDLVRFKESVYMSELHEYHHCKQQKLFKDVN